MRFSLFPQLLKPRSLAAQLLRDAVLGFAIVVLGMGALSFVLYQSGRQPRSWEGLKAHTQMISKGLQIDSQGKIASVRLPPDVADSYDGLPKDLAYQVISVEGAEIFASPSGSALASLRQVPLPLAPSPVHDEVIAFTSGDVSLGAYTERVEKFGNVYLIRVARSTRVTSMVRTVGTAIFFGSVLVTTALALLIFAWFVLRTVHRLRFPLQQASRVASTIGAANLSARLENTGLPAELNPLISSFNDALARLETGYRVQQEFLASAAHELKTPLALIRAEIESIDAEHRPNLLGDIDHMARQIQQLLHLAEAREAHNYVFEELQVEAAVVDARDFANRLADRKGVALQVRSEQELPSVRADRGALFILLKNLLENAIQHSQAGEVVSVSMDRRGLTIIDQGPGVPVDERPMLFQRFWRGQNSLHPGAGLGLAICKEIADAHCWHLRYEAETHDPRGARFRIDFGQPTCCLIDHAI